MNEISIRYTKGWQTVIGGFLIHLVLGTLYCWANFTSSVTSRLRLFHPSITYEDTIIVYAASLAGQGSTMIIGGLLSQRFGARACCMLGGGILIAGTFLASISNTLIELIFAQGIMLGVGIGLCYTAPISAAVRWLPAQKGLVTGIIVGGFGLGAFVFGIIASLVVNPSHETVMMSGPDKGYFPANSAVVTSVPTMFQVLALTYTGVMTMGCSLLHDYDEERHCNQSDLAAREVSGSFEGLMSDNFSPKDLLVEPLMWHVASCMTATTLGGMYIAGTFKVYAQSYFANEEFLAVTASAASLFNSFGRVIWGQLADRFGSLRTLQAMSLLFSIAIFIFPFSIQSNTSFVLSTFLVFFFEGANFVLYVPLTVQLFGNQHSAGNYSMIFTSYAIVNVLNILILAATHASFQVATRAMSALTFLGFINLLLLQWHISLFKARSLTGQTSDDCKRWR